MAAISKLDSSVIESISKLLGDTNGGFTGSQIATLLNESRIEDIDSANTKWRRLNSALVNKQNIDKCANNILAFIEKAMSPASHYNNQEWFNNIRFELNKILAFAGYSLGENGKISITSKSSTISESVAKASKLKEHLLSRKVHPDILTYCQEELLVDNYFHVVFEATKSVADKIRIRTGLTSDGASLIDEAFSFKEKIPHPLRDRSRVVPRSVSACVFTKRFLRSENAGFPKSRRVIARMMLDTPCWVSNE